MTRLTEKGRGIRDMFDRIAPRYDLLNHVLSLNIDRSWRRKAVDWLEWNERPEGVYLAGSGFWYPHLGPGLLEFDVEVTLPESWQVISQGNQFTG